MKTKTKHHVTQKEIDAVLAFAIEVLVALRMPAWTVLLMWDPCGDDALATIKPIDGRYVAELHLCADWMDRSDEVRRNTITHEMLHLVHARVDSVIDDTTNLMHDHEWENLRNQYVREMELLVDHFATFMSNTHTLEKAWEVAHGRA